MEKTENRIMFEVYSWFHNHFPEYRGLYCLNYNNPKNEIQGAVLNGLGLQKGRPDVSIYIPNKSFHALLIEYKTPKGKARDEQLKNHEKLTKFGYKVEIINDVEKGKELILKYLSEK